MSRILTHEYRLRRTDISLSYAIEYFRSFWWAISGMPVFGLVCLILVHDAVVKMFGAVCLLWPLTVPARAFILTSKASRQMMKPTVVELTSEHLLFKAADGTGTRLHLEVVRSVRRRGHLYVIRTRRLAMGLIPVEAFLGEEERLAFEELGKREA